VNKLVCTDCRHENELERIYCHNCGARLDRSGIKKEKIVPEDGGERTRQHLAKLFNPARNRNKLIALRLLKLVLGALGAAVVIQMLLPPDLPEPAKVDVFAPMINMDLFTALESRNPPRLVYSEEQVNAYLDSVIRKKQSPAQEGFFPIRRVFVQFEEGLCRINIRHRFFGLPLSLGGFYHVSIEQGKIEAANTGGYIGRMAIHPALMRGLNFLFQKTWTTLARERKDVARLVGIEFHPQSVTLVTAR
jgi:hypothetical protein